jgi:MFS family permease
MLAVLAAAELLGMSLWFAASAVATQLSAGWQLTGSETAWLTSSVQLGFVVGTMLSAVLNLADIVPARVLFATCAGLGAIVNAALLLAPGFRGALALRLLTGFFLAGVYPPAMKMGATWFRAQRGLAVGTIVGALTVGKAGPYLVHAIPGAGVVPVILSSSLSAAVAAMLVLITYRDGPYAFPQRPFSWGLVGTVTRSPTWRYATGGYLGHMFELYSFWTWVPAFLGASAVASGMTGQSTASLVSASAFAAIAIGGVGCVWGGVAADRRGREWLVTLAMAISGACCLLSALFFGAPFALVVALSLLWGVFVVADSAQFSVLVTESVPPHAVGTALTIQTSLGFLLTLVTIQGAPLLASAIGWRWAFPGLALGPALGIASIRRFAQIRQWGQRTAAAAP